MDPIFVRAQERYQSYHDFWRLVELSGFKAVSPTDVDFNSTDIYIWAEANAAFLWALKDHPKGMRRARMVLWSLERPDMRASTPEEAIAWWRRGLGELLGLVDALWVSDRTLQLLDPRTQWVCLGGHPGLREKVASGPSYGVAHLGQLTPRRLKVIDELKRRGITVSPNAWGVERAAILGKAKLLLGVERLGGIHVTMPLRWALSAAYALPIVQETLALPDPLVPEESVLMAPLEELPDRVEEALQEDVSDIGKAAWETYCVRHPFREEVLQHVSA